MCAFEKWCPRRIVGLIVTMGRDHLWAATLVALMLVRNAMALWTVDGWCGPVWFGVVVWSRVV